MAPGAAAIGVGIINVGRDDCPSPGGKVVNRSRAIVDAGWFAS